MQGLGWISAIIVGGLAGWIAEKIMHSDMGVFANIVLGIVGAILLNALLAGILGFQWSGWIGQLVIGAVGACILIWITRMIRGRRA